MQASPLARRCWSAHAQGEALASHSLLTAAAVEAVCAGLPSSMFVVGYDTRGPAPLCFGAGLAEVLTDAPAHFTAADFTARLHPDDAELVKRLTTLVVAFSQRPAATPLVGDFSCCFRLRNGAQDYLWVQRTIALAELRPAATPHHVLHYYSRLAPHHSHASFGLVVTAPNFWAWLRPRLDAAGLPELSGRQREVLHLLLQGLTNCQVAEALCLSPDTVKTHHRALRAKLPERNIRRLAWLLGE